MTQRSRYTGTEYALQFLRASGELVEKKGIHGAPGKISREFKFTGEKLIEALNTICKAIE